jgi:hypothetical protein
MWRGVAVWLCVCLAVGSCSGSRYLDGDALPVFVNTIGPYANPAEVYSYYSLPFCAPPKGERAANRGFNLGEQLEGDEFKQALYSIKFKGNTHPSADDC